MATLLQAAAIAHLGLCDGRGNNFPAVLELVCQKLGKGTLVRVRALAERYTNLVPTTRPFISRIEIQPIRNQGAAD